MNSVTITQKHIDKLQAKLDEANKRKQKLKMVVNDNGIGLAIGKFK